MAVNSDPMTLTRFVLARQRAHPEASGDFTQLVSAVATACKAISAAVRKAGLVGLFGLQGGAANASGDAQKKLDVIANDIFKNMLRSSGAVAVMVSEEDEAAVLVAEAPDAKYVVVFDPLDGSSNIDCNVSVGSIFGVYRRRQDPLAPARFAAAASAADALRPGDELVAAGYANYGSATQLCLALAEDAPDAAAGREAKGVNVFSLDTEVGEFIMSHACLRIPATPKRIYSINAGGLASMPRAVRRFVAECNGEAREGAGAGGGSPAGASAAASGAGGSGTGAGAGAYSLRYVGSMVADVHRTLVYGGVFLYPATKASPSGKLRLLYEAAPIALITECAGGKAITGATGAGSGGSRRLLELVPAALHERVPVALGCARDVTRLEELLAAEE